MQKIFGYSKYYRGYLMTLLVFSFSLMSFSLSAKLDNQNIEFDIYLNDTKVGQQSVIITPTETGEKVVIKSEFTIKILFVNVFSYQHTAREDWRESCLNSIESKTKETGDRFFVASKKTDQGLSITSNSGTADLQGCIRSFAYWDLPRLDSERLLNGQTGKYVPATLIANGVERFLVNDKEIRASRYTLTAEKSDIHLWYDENQNWVGLTTLVKGGRTLSYRLRP
jgi:hypothetical protein